MKNINHSSREQTRRRWQEILSECHPHQEGDGNFVSSMIISPGNILFPGNIWIHFSLGPVAPLLATCREHFQVMLPQVYYQPKAFLSSAFIRRMVSNLILQYKHWDGSVSLRDGKNYICENSLTQFTWKKQWKNFDHSTCTLTKCFYSNKTSTRLSLFNSPLHLIFCVES